MKSRLLLSGVIHLLYFLAHLRTSTSGCCSLELKRNSKAVYFFQMLNFASLLRNTNCPSVWKVFVSVLCFLCFVGFQLPFPIVIFGHVLLHLRIFCYSKVLFVSFTLSWNRYIIVLSLIRKSQYIAYTE